MKELLLYLGLNPQAFAGALGGGLLRAVLTLKFGWWNLISSCVSGAIVGASFWEWFQPMVQAGVMKLSATAVVTPWQTGVLVGLVATDLAARFIFAVKAKLGVPDPKAPEGGQK